MIGAFTALIIAGVLTLAGWLSGAIMIIALISAVEYSSAYGYTLEKIASEKTLKTEHQTLCQDALRELNRLRL